MGKHKLARWAELGTFKNVIEAEPGSTDKQADHFIKGNWRSRIFSNNNPLILELGCGKGEYTTGLALKYPMSNFVGVDIKGARLWRGAKTASENNLVNSAFLRTRIEFIDNFFAPDEVDEIWITFPDPQPGWKNVNKRLTSPWFLNKYRKIIKDQGLIHLKTDNKDLWNYTGKIVAVNGLQLTTCTDDLYGMLNSGDISSICTYYEKIYLGLGLKINYLAFRLPKTKNIKDETQG